MSYVTVRFYAELNDFLPQERRGKETLYASQDGQQISDFLNSNNIPHENVDLILRNGKSVALHETLNDGDRLSCYPIFESLDIRDVTRIRSMPLRQPRFVLDVHLGKLASFLRMLGFDTLYDSGVTDTQLLDISVKEERTLLSKDRELLKNETLTRGYRVLSDDPREQIEEILHRFDLFSSTSPFSRCIRCNTPLEPIRKEKIVDRLPLKVQQFYDEFFYCDKCDQIFWKGSHYEKMRSFIDGIIENKGNPSTRPDIP
ncbi:MAG: Mut7-C RNAse domain-containing protein [Bacteroidota bacterium]